jgi:hypothetical protein
MDHTKPFWIARVEDDQVVCKKTTADELDAAIAKFRKFNPFRSDQGKPKLRALYRLSYDNQDYLAVKRIIKRGTDGRVGVKRSEYGSFTGGYAVSFISSKAARLMAEKMLSEKAEMKAEAEAKEREESEKKAKHTEKHLTDNRKVWVSSFLVDRYCGGDRFDVQMTIGDIAKTERAFIMDDEIGGGSQIYDLMTAISVERVSPLRRALKLVEGKTTAIMTEEGYHVISTDKVAAAKKRDDRLVKEMLCDW